MQVPTKCLKSRWPQHTNIGILTKTTYSAHVRFLESSTFQTQGRISKQMRHNRDFKPADKVAAKKVLDCYMLPRELFYWCKWSKTILNSNEINIVSVIHYKKINFPSIIRPKGHINKYYVINIHPFVTEERILKANPWFFYYFLRHFGATL